MMMMMMMMTPLRIGTVSVSFPSVACQLPPADPLKIQLPQKQRLLVRPANQHRVCHKLPIPFKDFRGFLWKWDGSSMEMGVQNFPLIFGYWYRLLHRNPYIQ